jgi:two-component system chemotaxis response regulator CheV
MSELLKNIDARTKLAGTNKLEILLFFLGIDQRTGRRETYGINVFKVREVMRTPVITAAPDMPPSVEGMVSLRGHWCLSSIWQDTLAFLPRHRVKS